MFLTFKFITLQTSYNGVKGFLGLLLSDELHKIKHTILVNIFISILPNSRERVAISEANSGLIDFVSILSK
jgi:hypothetical protein